MAIQRFLWKALAAALALLALSLVLAALPGIVSAEWGVVAVLLGLGGLTAWGMRTSWKRGTDPVDGAEGVARALPARPLPRAPRPIELPASDTDIRNESTARGAPAHALFLLEYTDAEGKRSRRRVTIRRVTPTIGSDGGDDAYLDAYCHEREAKRTFLLSRVRSLTDVHTGEVVTDIYEALALRLPVLDQAFDRLENEILVLAYLARADGRMQGVERDVIVQFVLSHSIADIDTIALAKRISRVRCEEEDFSACLRSIRNGTLEIRQSLLQAARDLVSSDERVHANEAAALQQLESYLRD